MVEINPFRGLRYAQPFAAPEVYAPPYDVISPAQRAALLAQDAHNIVHLDLGPTPPDPAWYAQAADTLQAWLARGVLVRDTQPSFYGYRQRFVWQGATYTRTGLIARVRLTPWGQGIYRHELTRNQPKADRLQLMRALNMQTSPVWGLFEDTDGAATACLRANDQAIGASTAPDFTDADGIQHTLWRIAEPTTIATLQATLRASEVVIADGHHRYETALALAAERQAAGGPSPADQVMMHLTPLNDPGLLVLATHRAIKSCSLSAKALLLALAQRFRVTPTATSLANGSTLVSAIAGQAGAFVLRLPGQSYLLTPLAPQHPTLTELDVVTLQQQILEPVLGISPDQLANADLLSYTIDEAQACQEVDSGAAALALILNPTPLRAIWETALRGEVMPQKSTFFHPKLLTGLVLNPLWP